MARPVPPGRLQNGEGEVSDRPFEPAPDLAAWIIETFITEGAALCNEDHAHLRDATIGALWSAVPQFRHGQRIVGQANLGRASVAAPKWYQARFATADHRLVRLDTELRADLRCRLCAAARPIGSFSL